MRRSPRSSEPDRSSIEIYQPECHLFCKPMEMGNTKAAGRLRVSVSMVITKLRKSSRAGKNRVPFIILFLLLMGVGIAQAGTDLKYSVSWIGNSFSGKHQWVL